MENLSYLNEKGETVFSSLYHKKRGYCCNSDCLHCPFGKTLKALGLTFEDISSENEADAQKALKLNESKDDSLTDQLLMGAFGSPKRKVSLSPKNYDSFKLIYIKKTLCGLLYKSKTQVKEVYLLNEFKDQGISKDIVESFFFS